jgi:hypothetical protein
MTIRWPQVGEVFKFRGCKLQVMAVVDGEVFFHDGSRYLVTIVDTANFERVDANENNVN